MVDLEKIRIFYHVAMEGSLLKASSVLVLSSPSISKHLTDLENKLNVKLFIRKRRGLKLTEEGERLYAIASHAIRNLEEIAKDISLSDVHAPDFLRIVTTNGISLLWVIERVKKFLDLSPNVNVKIYTRDDDVEFLNSRADVGILPKVKDQQGVTLRKLHKQVLRMHASKEYLEKMGMPKTIEDLENHHMLGFYHDQIGFRGDMDWYLRLTGKRIIPRLTINNVFGLFEAARQGLGIFSIPPEFPYIPSTDIVEVLGEQFQLEMESYFITRADQLDNVMIKQFYDCCSR